MSGRCRWQRVRAQVLCSMADSCVITAPAWALFGPWYGGRQFIACAQHAKQFYQMDPPATFTATHEGDDVKARQVGETK